MNYRQNQERPGMRMKSHGWTMYGCLLFILLLSASCTHKREETSHMTDEETDEEFIQRKEKVRQVEEERLRRAEEYKRKSELRQKKRIENLKRAANGHEFVDLGLSVVWATCNVGATRPSDRGHSFEWGKTIDHGDNFLSDALPKVYDGNPITKDISGDPEFDAARANWGGEWRMPTVDEMRELVDQCTWEWERYEGKYTQGYRVTGPNGQSIFLPYTYKFSYNYCGAYWTSSIAGEAESRRTWSLGFAGLEYSYKGNGKLEREKGGIGDIGQKHLYAIRPVLGDKREY